MRDFAAPSQEGAPIHRGILFWLSAWLPVAFIIGMIALESTEMLGSDHTSHPLRWLFEAIFGRISNTRWDVIHHHIRKSGHFFGYGFLGVMWLRAWWMSLPRTRFLKDAFLSLLGTALVASLDEWHQSYLPNRTGSVSDVMLDCLGAIVMLLAVYIYMRMVMPGRLARAE